MSEKEFKPYVFPEEMPAKEQKLDKGCIIDVVTNEINPPKPENPIDVQQNDFHK